MFTEPDNRPDFSKLDDAITKWWKENNIFEKQVTLREGAEAYVFYDGPPFMSGMPHYATLLSSLPKDAIPRYQAMKGKYVERLWGWDTHGLPIENKVENQLQLSGRQEILDYGLEEFINKCYEWNRIGIENWRWYIDKIGRWADIDNAYRTLDQDFMESIWWVFQQMWEKGLVYKGRRVSMFSTDSSTPVSDFEVSMDPDNYRETKDIAIAVKFKLEDAANQKFGLEKDIYAVAWTTTPWTIPANFALAVNAQATYVLADMGEDIVIFAKDLLENVKEKAQLADINIIKEVSGTDLEGFAYTPVYDFFKGNENDHHIYLSEAVTTTDGTGVLHVSPGFGEADFAMGEEFGLSFEQSVDDQGNMVVGPWKGTYLREANGQITKDLVENGNLLFKHSYRHRLPYYRYDKPLIYKVQENYFVDIQKIKQRLIAANEEINWVPEHFKHGRFEYILENAPDWSISRSRFWGTAMPLWVSQDGEELVVGSRDELMELVNDSSEQTGLRIQKITLELHNDCDWSTDKCNENIDQFISSTETELKFGTTQAELSKLRNKYFGETVEESQVKPIGENEQRAYYLINGKPLDMHRPFIDQVKFVKDGKEFSRIDFTLDVWMDSGSMPFAQFHYPFQNKEEFENNFPGDFIAEYTGQIRAWFYVLHVLGIAVMDKPAFKNVLVTGVLAGTDGRKMSKSFGNYPDPKETLEKYGGEALRLYFMGSTIMVGNDTNFSEDDLKLQIREFLLPLWNIYKYFVTYANMFEWVPREEYAYNKRNVWDDAHPWDHIPFDSPGNELDQWVLCKLQNTIGNVTKYMDELNLPKAISELKDFLGEVSRWYIRRSRDRFAAGEDMALAVLYYLIVEFCKLAAPITPFITEEIYRNLVVEHFGDMPESVHLSDYPVVEVPFLNDFGNIIQEMEIVRQAAELGQQVRAENGLKVRQPLSRVEIQLSSEQDQAGEMITSWMRDLIADELNVKEVVEVPQVTTSETTIIKENHKAGITLSMETKLTPELEEEGLVREIVRQVQNFRKNAGLEMGEEVALVYSADQNLVAAIEKHKSEIMEGISASRLERGEGDTEVKINDQIMMIKIDS